MRARSVSRIKKSRIFDFEYKWVNSTPWSERTNIHSKRSSVVGPPQHTASLAT